jgi:hypothetical protein
MLCSEYPRSSAPSTSLDTSYAPSTVTVAVKPDPDSPPPLWTSRSGRGTLALFAGSAALQAMFRDMERLHSTHRGATPVNSSIVYPVGGRRVMAITDGRAQQAFGILRAHRGGPRLTMFRSRLRSPRGSPSPAPGRGG